MKFPKVKLPKFYFDMRRIGPLAIISLFMAVTIGHVAAFTGSFEQPAWRWLGWPYAIAVDSAIIICSQFTKWKTTRLWAWVGYFVFVAASGAMNVAAVAPIKWAAWVYATFPTAAISLLGFLYGQVDRLAAGKENKKRKESEDKTAPVAVPSLAGSQSGNGSGKSGLHVCWCGRTFAHQNGLNAHQRSHSGDNGGEAVAETVSGAEVTNRTRADLLQP